MATILRIDIDTAYQNRMLNYIRVNRELFPGIDSLGYLKSCNEIADDLHERGIQASFFFMPTTMPNKRLAQEFKQNGHDLGLHAVHTKNCRDFSADTRKASKKLGNILGFTKHGSGKFKLSRSHDQNYDLDKYIEFAKKANLRFFLGNGENPEEEWQFKEGVLCFPSAFWLNRNYRADKFTVNWLVEHSRYKDVVFLVHPEEIIEGTDLMIEEYERVLEKVDFAPISQKIRELM